MFFNVPPVTVHTYRMRFDNAAATGITPRVHVMRISGTGLFPPDTDNGTTIVHPALCDRTIAVGAWTHRDGWVNYTDDAWDCCNLVEDTLAPFSSRGARVDGLRKPDLVAPGANHIATRDPEHGLTTRFIDNDGLGLDGSGPADYYILEGTSQAAPMAAGTAALVIEADPSLAPPGVRNALTGTASAAAAPDHTVGYGLIDALAAVQSVPAPGTDDDGDWHPAPADGGEDCDDLDANVWSTPGATSSLRFVHPQTLEWGPPADPGAAAVTYDVLRSTTPESFGDTSACVATGGTDHAGLETAQPAPGQAWYYLVRAVNGCPQGLGSLGEGTGGGDRSAPSCG